MDEILKDKLYLGDYRTIKTQTELFAQQGITDVINVAAELSYSNRVKDFFDQHGIQSYKFPMDDHDDYNIRRTAPEIINLLHLLISNGQKVYLHCHMGVSRSAAVIIGYLASHYDLTINQAFKLVKSKRPVIWPRQKFLDDLKKIID